MSSPNGAVSPADATLDGFAAFCALLELDNGRPFVLEPFERVLLADYFAGARESLVLMPKKNGKTTLTAALTLHHLLITPDAECVVAAASRDQARILLEQAQGFIRRAEGLHRRLYVKDREIMRRDRRGRIRILAADADTADGVIPTLAVVDELHRAKSAELYGIFRDGLGPRGGRMITISTAGDSEASVLGEMRAAAHRLRDVARDGKHTHARSDDGGFAMHEWALDRDDDRDDLDVVKLANPASWQTVGELERRKRSPSMLAWQWARFACGVWTASETWWVTGEQWRAAQSDDRLAPGDRIAVGFDGSRYGDATALMACRLEDGLLELLGVWEAPEGGGEWEVPAGAVDARLADAMTRYQVVRGYFDPPLWRTEIEEWEREYGSAVRAWATNRPTPMSAAVERFRTDLVVGRLHHTGDPTLARHVMNARTKEVRGGYWLTKDRPASPDKIDAAVAAVLAYEARCDALEAQPSSREVMFI